MALVCGTHESNGTRRVICVVYRGVVGGGIQGVRCISGNSHARFRGEVQALRAVVDYDLVAVRVRDRLPAGKLAYLLEHVTASTLRQRLGAGSGTSDAAAELQAALQAHWFSRSAVAHE